MYWRLPFAKLTVWFALTENTPHVTVNLDRHRSNLNILGIARIESNLEHIVGGGGQSNSVEMVGGYLRI